MFADRKSRSSPGLRALLGRFLHSLLPHRLLQLLGAAWSYLMGPWEASSGWLVHRSVQAEVGDFRPGLRECLVELRPWTELGVDVDFGKSWNDVCSGKDEESAFNELTSLQRAVLHRNIQIFGEAGLTSWKDVVEPNKTASLHGEIEPYNERRWLQSQFSSLDIISYIFNVGAGEVLPRVDSQNLDPISGNPCHSEFEIQHVRKKRLKFLQQTLEGFTSDAKQVMERKELPDLMCFSSPNQPHWSESQNPIIYDQYELLSDVGFLQGDEIDKCGISCDQLPVVVQEVDQSSNLHHICDKDQGYHSLEYWQCSLPQNLTNEIPETCKLDGEPTLFALPSGMPDCASFEKDKNDEQNSEDMDTDLQGEIPISSVTFCTNKHIGYILGTVVSDDDRSPSSADEWDKEEDDDGFDSEGSVPSTDSEADVPEDVIWNSFGSDDPYNLQNFTASLQTGVLAGENSLYLDQHESDEESWCESDAESGSDSESNCSADEEENLKLWNAFLKSDDPYNPLYFKALVKTSDIKRQSSEMSSTYPGMVCRCLPNHKVITATCQAYDLQQLQLKEAHNVPVEDSRSLGYKKVTFHESVTIHYVCDEEERKGHWEEFARDRCRFQRRIMETEFVIGHCLTPDHRQRAWERLQEQWGS